MSGATENYIIEPVDLHGRPALYAEFVEGQRMALRSFGIADGSIAVAASEAPRGSHAVIARAETGELIAGLRVFSRSEHGPLPIESESSPLSAEQRQRIAGEPGLCEVGALWVAPYAAGRFLSRRMAAYGTILGYRLGFRELISLSHLRAFKFISGPLGYERETGIPSMAYPDERFETIVIRFRAGLVAALRNVEAAESFGITLRPAERRLEL